MTIVTHPDCSGLLKTVSLESNCFLGDTSLWSGVDVTENIMAMESNYFLGDASLAAGCRFFYHCTSDFILQGFGWITQVNNVPFIAVAKLQAEFETFCSACRAVHYKNSKKKFPYIHTRDDQPEFVLNESQQQQKGRTVRFLCVFKVVKEDSFLWIS